MLRRITLLILSRNLKEIRFAFMISSAPYTVKVSTTPSLTAIRGQEISLPCIFTGQPNTVSWYRYVSFSHSCSKECLLVSGNNGHLENVTDPRFNLKADYTLEISAVETKDAATYACVVDNPDGATGRNDTELTVICEYNLK